MGTTTPGARRSPLATVAIVLAAAAGALAGDLAAARDHHAAAPHLDRNTRLDRSAVSFLKGLLKTGAGGRERLVVVGPDGQVLGSSDGSESEVEVPDIDRSGLPEGEGVTLVHSHPSSTSFSRADLLHLSRPGVEAVVAIGSDGSVYFAARGPRFVVNALGPIYDSASSGAQDMWRSAAAFQGVPRVNPAPHFAHIVAQALALADLIVYRASMPFDRERSYFDGTVLYALMSEAAASDAKEALGPQ